MPDTDRYGRPTRRLDQPPDIARYGQAPNNSRQPQKGLVAQTMGFSRGTAGTEAYTRPQRPEHNRTTMERVFRMDPNRPPTLAGQARQMGVYNPQGRNFEARQAGVTARGLSESPGASLGLMELAGRGGLAAASQGPLVQGMQQFARGYRGDQEPPPATVREPTTPTSGLADTSRLDRAPGEVPHRAAVDRSQPEGLAAMPATGRDAYTPRQGDLDRARGLAGATITQGPAGMQRQVFDDRTRYAGQGGYAEFQGAPRGGGGFGGARTDAEAQARLADYRERGLNAFGNDMTRTNEMTAETERLQMSRLQNRLANPEFGMADRVQAMQGLAVMQQGGQARDQAAAQGEQRRFDNALALRQQERMEALAQLQISEAAQRQLQRDPFSEEGLRAMYSQALENSMGDPRAAGLIMSQWASLFDGIFDPASDNTFHVYSPRELAEMTDDQRAAILQRREEFFGDARRR